MKKINKIFTLIMTGALSVAMAFSTAFTVKPVQADDVSVDSFAQQFESSSRVDVVGGYDMPSYIKARGFWQGPGNGVKLTFNGVGKDNSITFKKAFELNELETLIKFNAIPNENFFKMPAVEFENFHTVIYEVDNNGTPTGKEVTFVYNSAYKNSLAIKGSDLNGEVSSYFTAFASNGNETQKPAAYINDGRVYASSKDPSITGTPRHNSAGAGGSTAVQASMQDTASPMVFGYTQTGEGDTLVCKGTASPVRYASVVRIFNESRDPSLYYNETQITSAGYVSDSVVFAGFDPSNKFKVKFYVDKFSSGATQANFLLYQVGNVSLINRISAKMNYNGIASQSFDIPDPIFYDANGNVSGSQLYSVRVKNSEGLTISASKTVDAPAGDYTATYTFVEGTSAYSCNLNFKIVESVSDLILYDVVPATEFNKVYGSDYVVGAKATSGVYTDNSTPTLTAQLVKKEGDNYTFIKNVQMGEIVNIKGLNLPLGNYAVKYSAVDAIGRTKETYVELNQNEENRAFVNLLQGVENGTENFYYGLNSQYKVSVDDVTIYDALLGRDFIKARVEIVHPNSSVYNVINSVDFDKYLSTFDEITCGKYAINYIYEYNYGAGALPLNKTITKYVNVVDAVAPYIYAVTDKFVFGAKIDAERTISNSSVYLLAKTGSKLYFDSIVAIDKVGEKYSLTDDIVLELVKPNGEKVNYNPNEFDVSAFEYVVDQKGQYVFRFTVSDKIAGVENRTSALVYVIEVEDNFYTVTANGVYDVDNNYDSFTLAGVEVVDYDGNKVTPSVSVVATNIEGAEVWSGVPGDVKNFVTAGSYTIKTIVKVNGVVVKELFDTVTIADELKPTIIFENDVIKKSVVGKEVSVPTVIASDENGYASLVLDVTLGKNTINVYQGKFTPIEAGSYKVTYTATDLAGNVTVYSYEILVIEDYEGSLAHFFNNYGLFTAIPLVLIAGVLYFIFMKKKPALQVEEDEVL